MAQMSWYASVKICECERAEQSVIHAMHLRVVRDSRLHRGDRVEEEEGDEHRHDRPQQWHRL